MPSNQKPDSKKTIIKCSYVLLFVTLLFTVLRQIYTLTYGEFADEEETVVVVKMLGTGYKLYSEIFDQHGPLVFLSGALIERIKHCGVSIHRIPILILQWCAFWSLYASPLIEKRAVKNIFLALAAVLIVTWIDKNYGGSYLYQALGGILLLIALPQYVLPAIIKESSVDIKKIAIGNILIASLPFLAIIYLPASALLFFASLRLRYYKQAILWLMSGLFLNLCILGYLGTFSGYIADHIYLNSIVLPAYGGPTIWSVLNTMRCAIYGSIESFLIFMYVVLAGFIIARQNFPQSFWRALFIILAILSFLSRSVEGFQALPYSYFCVGLLAVFAFRVKTVNWVGMFLSCAAIALLFYSFDLKDKHPLPKATEFSKLTDLITNPSDRIIAYSFQNVNYITANRLPASGSFFLSPWEVKYNKHPVLGVKIDSCDDIKKNTPKVMLINKWNYFDGSWESYGACIQKIMDRDYIKIIDKPFYVRKDIFAKYKEKIFEQGYISEKASKNMEKFTSASSSPLTKDHPIKLMMTSGHKKSAVGLKRLGIMFGTYQRINPGSAELRLHGEKHSLSNIFSLRDLDDNQYHYFDVDGKTYTSGEIVWHSGGGVSVWERHGNKNTNNSCIIYKYNNGEKRITYGCPRNDE